MAAKSAALFSQSAATHLVVELRAHNPQTVVLSVFPGGIKLVRGWVARGVK